MKPIEILKAGEPREVLEKLAGHELHAIAALGLASGMRRGELLALQAGEGSLHELETRLIALNRLFNGHHVDFGTGHVDGECLAPIWPTHGHSL